MDTRDARHLLANADSGYKRKSNRKVGEQRPARGDGDSYFSRNTKEDAVIEALDQRAVLTKYADWISDLRDGRTDVPSSLARMAPDMVVELLSLAMDPGTTQKVKLAAIQDWLDRAGYSKVQKIAAAVVDPNAPKEQLLSMLEGLNRKNQVIEIVDDDQDQAK